MDEAQQDLRETPDKNRNQIFLFARLSHSSIMGRLMKYSIFFGFIFLFLIDLADADPTTSGHPAQELNWKKQTFFPVVLESTHFFLSTNTFNLSAKQQKELRSVRRIQASEEDCRAQIKSLMCLAEPSEGKSMRECLPGGEQYAHFFETIYDQYPPALQKVFCSLDIIYIEKNFFGTAYAGSSLEDGTTIMGIRQSVLDENLNLNTWASWKDQLSFGGKVGSYEITPGLPIVSTSSSGISNDFLYFVVAHEFGHILDFANKVNDFKESCPEETEENLYPECEVKENSWSAISWITDRQPKMQNDFPNRTKLCFYMCESGIIPSHDIPQVYQSLYDQTDFISLYSATNPWDDFADSLAYFLMDKYLRTTYSADTKQGASYDVVNKLHSPLFQSKYKYLEDFINRADLKYP